MEIMKQNKFLMHFYSKLKELYYQLLTLHDQRYTWTVTNWEKLLSKIFILLYSKCKMQIHNMKLRNSYLNLYIIKYFVFSFNIKLNKFFLFKL